MLLKMLPLTVKFLIALTCFTAVYLTTEAADTCSTAVPCIPGQPGRDGKDGRDGIPGRDGSDGDTGPPGRDGVSGNPGRDGHDGVAGNPGRDGRDGVAGNPGRDGRDGVAGANGAVGQPGPPGAQGPPGLPGALTDTEQQQLKDDILNVLRGELSMMLQCEARLHNSCKELYQCNPATPSGYYNIRTPQGVERVYCEMETTNCGTITGGWTRAAFIDMTDESSVCPENLTYTVQSSIRMCGSLNNMVGCSSSVTFSTHMIPYTKVCGRARGYQYSSPDAFHHGQAGGQTIDGYYVDGLSVTHGSPRNHIWTFAAGLSKLTYYPDYNCPCAVNPGPASPPFVGSNYFCESGNTGEYAYEWYLDDPLWDSQGCANGSTCCDRGGPWFTTTLSQEVNDDIEVRWCTSDHGEDVGVDQLEIYVI